MWGLLGEDSTAPSGSAWKVVDGGSGLGKVLKGTASTNGPLALRGDPSWVNEPGETDYMNYSIQADVKL